MRTIEIEGRYLVVPVCEEADIGKLLFYRSGKLIFDLDIRIAAPGQTAVDYFINVERFGGSVDIETDPVRDFEIRFADSDVTDGLYKETRRPLVHFSAKRGWINDPNGLVEYTSPVTGKKTYHMFFQHNTCSVKWGNMHWGHATSADMIHWEQTDCALYPDEFGTMYSGSAIVDKDNKSGLKSGAEDVILLYYTAAGGNNKLSAGVKFSQCLAYSNDGGLTFTKYSKNPLVGHIAAENRDPKVIWCDPLSCYVMALYLDGRTYALFTSDNLLDWTMIQKLDIEGDAECPDFYPLTCDDDGKTKWILSGASHCYLVGDIKDGKFAPTQASKRLHYGNNSYASQTYSDVADGRRINAAWNTFNVPDAVFNCQMGIPAVHTLKFHDGEYYLCANPVREFESLRASEKTSVTMTGELGDDIGECAEIFIKAKETASDSVIKFSIYGADFVCDMGNNKMKCKDMEMPLSKIGNALNLRLICDKNSIEIYSNFGEVYCVIGHVATNGKFTLSTGKNAKIEVKINNLNPIW